MAHKRGGKIGTRSYAGIFHATMEKWAQEFLLTEISQLRCWGGMGRLGTRWDRSVTVRWGKMGGTMEVGTVVGGEL